MTLLTGTKTRDWESTFDSWCQGPGQTERERCERAVNAIDRKRIVQFATVSKTHGGRANADDAIKILNAK